MPAQTKNPRALLHGDFFMKLFRESFDAYENVMLSAVEASLPQQ